MHLYIHTYIHTQYKIKTENTPSWQSMLAVPFVHWEGLVHLGKLILVDPYLCKFYTKPINQVCNFLHVFHVNSLIESIYISN